MDRDENGKFAKGNSGGPGRPKQQREQRFYEITTAAVTFKDWRAIIKKAVEQATDGDQAARRFLADRLLGKPVDRHEITQVDTPEHGPLTDDERAARIAEILDAARARQAAGVMPEA